MFPASPFGERRCIRTRDCETQTFGLRPNRSTEADAAAIRKKFDVKFIKWQSGQDKATACDFYRVVLRSAVSQESLADKRVVNCTSEIDNSQLREVGCRAAR